MTASVLVFARSTPHHRAGGMEVQSWSVAAEWARSGRDVEVVTTAIPSASGPFVDDGVKVVPLPGTKQGCYSRSWWEASRAYWRSLDKPPGVVFSVSAGAYSVVLERMRFPGTPFVMQAHGTSAMELESKLTSRRLRSYATAPKNARALLIDLARYRRFDSIIAVGERVFASLTSNPLAWSVDPGKVRLIQNGVPLDGYGFDPAARERIRRGADIDEKTTVVVCVGRLHVQKGLDRTLQAAAVLRERGLADSYKIFIVGEGPDEQRLREIAAGLRVDGMVRFLGPAKRTEVRDFYSAADISVLSTAWLEGLPMAVLEALACGLPCVVTAGSVAAKALEPVLRQVNTADPGLLADALCEAVATKDHRASLLPPQFQLARCASSYLDEFDLLRARRRG